MSTKETKNAVAVRCLRILEMLPNHTFTGISNKVLAEHLNTSPTNISRALATLAAEGFAERMENGLWGPTVKLLAISMAYSLQVEERKKRIEEIQKFTLSHANTYLA